MSFSLSGQFVLTLTRVVIFAAFHIANLQTYYSSDNPTYDGIPASMFGLAELYCSVITTTTPLLKGFILRFKIIGATGHPPGVRRTTPPIDTPSSRTTRSTPIISMRNKVKTKGKRLVGKRNLADYEQWSPNEKPPKRHDSHCGDTDVTAKTDDDRSDRSLHRDRERQQEMDRDAIGLAEEP
jgi:hypothetical protein